MATLGQRKVTVQIGGYFFLLTVQCFLLMKFVGYKCFRQSKDINKTETDEKHAQRPMICETDQVLCLVTKRGFVFTVHWSLINWPLWRGNLAVEIHFSDCFCCGL